jgi:hypothetical protein
MLNSIRHYSNEIIARNEIVTVKAFFGLNDGTEHSPLD